MWKKSKKIIAFLINAVLVLGTLSGCGNTKDTEEDTLTGQQKGRYVETELTMPQELADGEVKQIFRVNEELHLLLSREEERQASLQEWVLREGGSFEEVTGEWLKSLSFPHEEYGKLKLMQDKEGTQYLYATFSDETDQYYQGHLWKSNGDAAVDITPEKWRVLNEDMGFYEYALDITLLDDGTMVSYFWLSIDTFLAEDGSLVNSITPESRYGEWIEAVGDRYYLQTRDSMDAVNGVEIHQSGQDNAMETIPFSQEKSGYAYFSIMENGDIIAADADGFFRCKEGDTNWEKLIEGSDTSFVFTDIWCKGMTALADGTFYALFGSSNGTKLMEYRYDPDAVVEVTETLTLYTVYESYLLQQAAALYHKEHPEVLIQIEAAASKMASYTEELDYQQIYQDLNTSLMGGDAADILVMDHLDIDSYASKGLLADINDVVSPLEEDGSILSNITGTYLTEDGKRYVVPLQFGMMFVIGRDVPAEEMGSMEKMAEFLAGKEESYLGTQTAAELVDKFYPYFAEGIVQDKELNREELETRLSYLKEIAENCGMVEKREANERCYNVWEIASYARLAFCEAEGFNDAMFPISAANLVNGEFTCFEQAYYPKLQMGINSKSEHLDTAKDFLRFVLSETIQDTDHYEGFPVNTSSLETQAAADRSMNEAYTTIEIGEGMEEEFIIKAFSDEDAQKLVDMCRNVHVRAKEDTKIREELIAALPGYLNGAQTIQETIDQIEGGLKMYLAE